MCFFKTLIKLLLEVISVADPEGQLPVGRIQNDAKRRRGRLLEGDTPSHRWGSGGPPPGFFFEKWMQMVQS